MKPYAQLLSVFLILAGSALAQTVFTSSTTLNTNGQALGAVTINSGVTVDGNAGVTVTAEASDVFGTLLVPTGFTYNAAGYNMNVGRTVGSTGTLSLTGGNVIANAAIAGHDGGTGTVNLNGGTLTTTTVERWTGGSTLNFAGGTLRAAGDHPALINGYTLGSLITTGAGAIIDTNGFNVGLNSTFSGAGGLTKTGAGTLTLNAASIYTGETLILAGTLRFGVANALLSTSVNVAGGAVLDLNGNSLALTTLTGAGTVMMGTGGVLTIGFDTVSKSFAGGLSGTGDFIKTGSGTLTLTGVNAYSGITDVKAGSLVVAGGSISHPASFLKVQNTEGAFFTVQGGSISVQTSYIGFNLRETGTGNISSGTWTNASGVELGYFPLSAGTLTLTGGTVTAPQVVLGRFGGSALLQLNGGVLETSSIVRYTAACTFSADGGTLRATGDTGALFNGFTAGSAVIQSGGLTLDTNGFTVSTNAEFTGIGSLTKTGAGTFTLSGNFAHTGQTIVHAGTLALSSASLSDSAGVVIASGAILSLTHSSTDTISALIIDGVPQVSGTWGAIGSGAQHETARITGTGRLLILSPSAFAAWSTMFGLTGPNALHSADPDADGALNLLEFYSGSSPVSAGPVAPTLLKTPTGLDFTYSRAKGVTGVTAIVEWTDDLVTWSISGVSEPTVVTDQGATEIVKVTVPAGSGTGRFVRLRVTSP